MERTFHKFFTKGAINCVDIHLLIVCELYTLVYQPFATALFIAILHYIFLCRFLSRFIHHYLLEKMHYHTLRVYVFDYCRCCARNLRRIQYRFIQIHFKPIWDVIEQRITINMRLVKLFHRISKIELARHFRRQSINGHLRKLEKPLTSRRRKNPCYRSTESIVCFRR